MKLIEAKKVNVSILPERERDNAEKFVAVVYRDEKDRRCTMFVECNNESSVDILIKLINASKVIE